MKQSFKKYGAALVILLLLCMCVYLFILLITNRSLPVVAMSIISLLLVGVLPVIFLYLIVQSENTEAWKAEEKKLEGYIKQAMEEKNETPEGNSGILELMLSNMKELRSFYQLSRCQARGAFFLAVTMCIIGGLLLLLSISALLFLNSYKDTLTVGAIGGTIIEFVAATALFIYRRTLDQLNHYYRSLHENERFLSILNLTSRISHNKQDDVYMKIIDSQLTYINQENWLNMNKKTDSKESEQ